jgi:hypothetical protein
VVSPFPSHRKLTLIKNTTYMTSFTINGNGGRMSKRDFFQPTHGLNPSCSTSSILVRLNIQLIKLHYITAIRFYLGSKCF